MSSFAVAYFYHFLVHVAIVRLIAIAIKFFNRSAPLNKISYSAGMRVYYVKARFKKWVFKSWQKDVVFVEAWVEAGRLFHTDQVCLLKL